MRKVSLPLALLAIAIVLVGAIRTYAAVTEASVDVPKAIPDGPNPAVASVLNFSVAGTITDANVSINITHTWDDDIDITLASPVVGAQSLWNDCGGAGDNFNVTIDDDSVTAFPCANTTGITGTVRSLSGLAMNAFDASASAGVWTLSVGDDSSLCTGTLNSWSLTLDGAAPLPVELMKFEAN